MATKWLTSREHIVYTGNADQKDNSYPGKIERNCPRVHQTIQNGTQFKTYKLLKKINKIRKTYELFVSGISHLIFSDYGWLWVTETTESENAGKGRLLHHILG